MGWIALAAGVVGVVLGARQLVLAFAGDAEPAEDAASPGQAMRFVRGAMYVTGGLFLAFIGLAFLIGAASAAA